MISYGYGRFKPEEVDMMAAAEKVVGLLPDRFPDGELVR